MKTAITIGLTLIGITAVAIGVISMTKQTWNKTFQKTRMLQLKK